jgi:hypothetical protein
MTIAAVILTATQPVTPSAEAQEVSPAYAPALNAMAGRPWVFLAHNGGDIAPANSCGGCSPTPSGNALAWATNGSAPGTYDADGSTYNEINSNSPDTTTSCANAPGAGVLQSEVSNTTLASYHNAISIPLDQAYLVNFTTARLAYFNPSGSTSPGGFCLAAYALNLTSGEYALIAWDQVTARNSAQTFSQALVGSVLTDQVYLLPIQTCCGGWLWWQAYDFQVLGTRPTSTPTQPQGNTAAPAGATRINQSWNTPASDGGSPVTSYRIYRGLTQAVTCDDSNLVGTTSEPTRYFLHEGLQANTTYYVRVSAVNQQGEGACAPPAIATTATPSPPTSPTSNTASATGGTTVQESWSSPSSDGGANVTSYRLYFGTSPTLPCDATTLAATVDEAKHEYDYSNLTPGVTYYARVTAVNMAGEGECAPSANATTFTVPTQPQGNTANATSNSTLMQIWDYPASDGASSVESYRIYRGTNAAMPCDASTLVGTTSEPARTFTHTGLARSTTYYVRVSAVNAVGEGACAPPANATTPSSPEGVTPPGAPQGNNATADATSVNQSWAPPTSTGGAPITSYTVYRGTSASMPCDDETRVASLDSNTQSYVHSGLSSGVTYFVRVSANNTAGEGPCSTTASATTPGFPTEPLNLAANVTSTNLTLTWDPPQSDSGSPIQGYGVYAGFTPTLSCDDSTRVAINVSNSNHTWTFVDLPNGSTYARVSAINTVGEGPCSSAAEGNVTNPAGDTFPHDSAGFWALLASVFVLILIVAAIETILRLASMIRRP